MPNKETEIALETLYDTLKCIVDDATTTTESNMIMNIVDGIVKILKN